MKKNNAERIIIAQAIHALTDEDKARFIAYLHNLQTDHMQNGINAKADIKTV